MERVDINRFDELLKENEYVVCDFYTTWCGPCKVLTPIIEELSQSYADKALFIKVDIDLCIELAVRYKITSIPTVIVFKNGEIADRTLGYTSREDMEEFLNKNL